MPLCDLELNEARNHKDVGVFNYDRTGITKETNPCRSLGQTLKLSGWNIRGESYGA